MTRALDELASLPLRPLRPIPAAAGEARHPPDAVFFLRGVLLPDARFGRTGLAPLRPLRPIPAAAGNSLRT